jgi:hypothetical protein
VACADRGQNSPTVVLHPVTLPVPSVTIGTTAMSLATTETIGGASTLAPTSVPNQGAATTAQKRTSTTAKRKTPTPGPIAPTSTLPTPSSHPANTGPADTVAQSLPPQDSLPYDN